jgi:hypothetical protein
MWEQLYLKIGYKCKKKDQSRILHLSKNIQGIVPYNSGKIIHLLPGGKRRKICYRKLKGETI